MLQTVSRQRVIVIGAGIGGLAAAVRLADAGMDVEVLELGSKPGGKLRTFPSPAGPVDAGPTVFTMRPVFEELFASVGERLEDHLELIEEPLLARHWWPDGSTLDLHADPEASAEAIREFSGPRSADQFRRFCARARRLFEAFDGPIMRAPRPNLGQVIGKCLADSQLMRDMTPPKTLWRSLAGQFSDPRLAQLFARYATYVGGSPFRSPDILSLIWHAEASGVWRIRGGMVKLARALEHLAIARGARFSYDTEVSAILPGTPMRVRLLSGVERTADAVMFNGDPVALASGRLGPAARDAVKARAVKPRALSAYVWTFAAEPRGVDLTHHNVFFNTHYRREFAAIEEGRMPEDAALYVCAQDRGVDVDPEGLERFEIILNGPAVRQGEPLMDVEEEYEKCMTVTFDTLARRGLTFSPIPGPRALTTPRQFATRFPGSEGSLYGQSPHGMMATFRRPTVRSAVPGLYLAGGGVHPGAGLPMAMSSGRHAAEAILRDHVSISTSRHTDTRGGMWTASRTAAPTVSRSSPS
ncbi:MAG: 1-hydroxycarotenoid 3,4-desaturase CrtD [Pseudomonadota bacterium]